MTESTTSPHVKVCSSFNPHPQSMATVSDGDVASLRSFNRFYTQYLGILSHSYLDTGLSLTEVRVLYELSCESHGITSASLSTQLSLDPGYLSRILKDFEKNEWIIRTRSEKDKRTAEIQLTAAGRKAYEPMKEKAEQQVREELARLTSEDRINLRTAMETIQEVLRPPLGTSHGKDLAIASILPVITSASPKTTTSEVYLRQIQPGDLGWVVSYHGTLYSQEYDWNVEFECLVAGIAAQIGKDIFKDPLRNRGWIAERLVNGAAERVGSIFVVDATPSATTVGGGDEPVEIAIERIAKIRLLAVSSACRGVGLGGLLTSTALQFCRNPEAGFTKVTLWTHSDLKAARQIYRKEGFKLVAEEVYDAFGKKALRNEVWELVL